MPIDIWISLYIAYYVPIHINRQTQEKLLILIKMKVFYLQLLPIHLLIVSYTLTSSLSTSVWRHERRTAMILRKKIQFKIILSLSLFHPYLSTRHHLMRHARVDTREKSSYKKIMRLHGSYEPLNLPRGKHTGWTQSAFSKQEYRRA